MASKPNGPILTLALPVRCPALWDSVPARTSESGGVTRLTCAACGWSERYLVVARLPDPVFVPKDDRHLAFKKRHRVGPKR